jgi:GNAT superfamily N-acetyltransferase
VRGVIEIRPVRPEEHDAVGELVVAAYNAIPGSVPDSWYDDQIRRVGERAAMVPVLVAVAADGAGEEALLGGLTYVPWSASPFAELAEEGEVEIRMFGVAPVAQGRGAGSALLDHVIARARREGRTGIALSTSPWMSVAQRLYVSRGFVRDTARDWVDDSGGVPFELHGYVLHLR